MTLIALYGILFICIGHALANPVPNKLKTVSNVTTADCAEGYTQPGGSNWPMCYKIYKRDDFRNDAKYMCESDNGHLASVPNAFVNSYLCSLAADLEVTYFSLGIQCQFNNCVNDDGTDFGYSNFAPGGTIPPTNCVYMQTKGAGKQTWLRDDCTHGFYFACEIPAGVVHEHYCPPDYLNFQGGCYKFFEQTHKISANDAADACSKVPGGTLATSGGEKLNTFLADHDPKFPLYKDKTAFGLRCPHIIHNGDTSSCTWDDGEDFFYSAFKKGDPGMYNTGSGCCDFNGGKWEVCTPCETANYFNAYICQAPETSVPY